MPHVVLEGPITPEDIWLAFEPTEFHEGSTRFKGEEAYLSSDKESLLVRSLVVERGFPKHFYVRFTKKEMEAGRITICLDQMNRPDVSDGVKRLIGLYAWKILQVEPTAGVLSSNVEDYIKEPASE